VFVHGFRIPKIRGLVETGVDGGAAGGIDAAPPSSSLAISLPTVVKSKNLLYSSRMPNRFAVLTCALAFCLLGASAQNVDAAFPAGDTFRVIADSISIGKEKFSARLDAIRAEGREPLGLVLAGGSARAYAHIGVIQVLEDAGIRPDFIVANSMGAVVGMLYAAGVSPDTIAQIVGAVPLEFYFNLVLPTKGGIINADPFVGAVKEMVGDLDLSDTPIPIIVTGEDLKTRRQVELSAGEFSKAMATTFAMPAIFEPVPFGEFLLVDGGSTNLVPVEIAAKYSSRLIVSTAFYDKKMNYGNLLSVLSRTFDIGKTRSGIKALLAVSPIVIRNDVENISYMQFSSPAAIIELGRESALASIDEILGALPASSRSRRMPPELIEARAAFDLSIPRTLARLSRGALPDVVPSVRYKLRYKLFDAFERSAMELDGQMYGGLALSAAARMVRASVSSIMGLSGDPGRQWAVTMGMLANPFDTFLARTELRLWGDFGSLPEFFLEPDSLEILADLSWSSKGEGVVVRPSLSASIDYALDSGALGWETRAELTLDAGFGDRPLPPGAWAGFVSARAGAFADTLAEPGGSPRYGPEMTLKLGVARLGIAYRDGAALRGRVTGRFDMSGRGLSLERGDAYRGNALAGAAPIVIAANMEFVWLAKSLEFNAAELFLVKNMELGPYFDAVWLAGGGSGSTLNPDAFSLGLSYGTTLSFAGLAPIDLSLFLGLDNSGYPVLGVRAGRLFPAVK